ncbi:MAG: class I SAM-dependent methyltransferase [Chloroflexota bacterium]
MAQIQEFFNTHKPKSTAGIFSLVLPQVPETKHGIALDLCCGSGELTAKLAEKGYRAYGVDISSTFIGQSGAEAAGYVLGDVNAVPFADGAAALVCSIDSLQYFADPGATLAEMARLLEPGGTLIISCQNNYNPAGIKKWVMEHLTGKTWSPWLVHPIENHITYPWLVATLRAQGLEIEYVRGQQFLTAWVSLLPGFIRNWSPWKNKLWRSPARVAARVRFPRAIEESFLARFAMIVLIRAQKVNT